jgi:signal peptidase I
MASPRRPELAALLTLVLPGLGHLYAGRLRRALQLFVLGPSVAVGWRWLMAVIPAPVVNILLPLGLALAFLVFVTWDAVRAARAADLRPLPAFSRWYSCLAAWLLVGVVVHALLIEACHTTLGQFYRIHGVAMQSTLLEGDRILVNNARFGWRDPLLPERILGGQSEATRGEVVVFRFPRERAEKFIMRVVGLPGETVEIRRGNVRIDGRPLREPYVSQELRDDGDVEPVRVPAGSYFVLGDNRRSSNDSRNWGVLPQEDLIGRPVMILWSRDWNRIGHRLLVPEYPTAREDPTTLVEGR